MHTKETLYVNRTNLRNMLLFINCLWIEGLCLVAVIQPQLVNYPHGVLVIWLLYVFHQATDNTMQIIACKRNDSINTSGILH